MSAYLPLTRAFRTARSVGLAVMVASGMLLIGPAPAEAAPTAAAPATTIVSLTFDDGFASQYNALAYLNAHHMTGTFYVNSALLDRPGRLTTADLHTLAASDNEIAGHTLGHNYLPAEVRTEQIRDICNDRLVLKEKGFIATDFAYPYGAYDATTESLVASCGYNSARATGGLDTSPSWAESTPPRDAFAIRAAASVINTTTVAQLEAQISRAEKAGGGWVSLVFHNICTACGEMGFAPGHFEQLLTWLEAKRADGVVVRTVADVIKRPAQPVKRGPFATRPPGVLVNASVEQAPPALDGAVKLDEPTTLQMSTPYCWEPGQFGTNAGSWARTRVPHGGKWSETVTITSFASGDRKLLIRRDEGGCSPSVVVGKEYTLGAWYRSSASTRIVVYYGDKSGRWRFWVASPRSVESSGWQHLTWTTPPTPSDATHLSFGLEIASVGYLTTDQYSMVQYTTPVKGARLVVATTSMTALLILGLAARRARQLRRLAPR